MRVLVRVVGPALLAACAVSVQEEIRLGHEYATEIDRSLPVVRDAAVQDALDRVARPVLGYILAGREPGRTESAALNIAATAVFAKFSRDDERGADRAAVGYASRAGINPDGLVDAARAGRRDDPAFASLQRAVRALPPPVQPKPAP